MRSILTTLGSLKLAVPLLAALAIAKGAASIYEAEHGTEAALRYFYGSTWFAALMAAVGANVLSSLAVRWPPRRSQVGLMLAHLSVVMVLVGALITRQWAVHGTLWLKPNEARSDFDTDRWVLALASPSGHGQEGERLEIPIGPDGPAGAARSVVGAGKMGLTIERYAGDTLDEGEQVIADPNAPEPAVKIRLGHDQHSQETWIMGGQGVRFGSIQVRLWRVASAAMLARLLQPTSTPATFNQGRITAEADGKRYEVDVAPNLGKTVPLGDTGYRLAIREYLPHAQVMGKGIRSVSSRPVNPMLEFDVIAPGGQSERRRLFARFPEFASMHATASRAATSGPGAGSQPSFKFAYTGATVSTGEADSLDVLVDAGGKPHVRFIDGNGDVAAGPPVEIGKPMTTPWQGVQVAVLQVLPKARAERSLTPIPPRKQNAVPAAFVCLAAGDDTYRLWVRRGESYNVRIGKRDAQVSYAPERSPMGFSIKLLAPVITHYPGTTSPRTYQSRVLVEDPSRGVKQDKTISMNAPLKYGGYTLFQSSYQFDQRGNPTASMLSIARDLGQPVVYIGYGGLMLGLVIALVQRLGRRA